MALALGTNSGFVTVAPTADPAGTGTTLDGNAVVTKHTSPAGATTITEIGWYRASGTNAANWEIALYSDLAGVPVTRLFVDATNSSTSNGWLTVAVNWSISESTAYWLALQMDAHSGSSQVDAAASGGAGSDLFAASTLADPYAGGAVADADGMYAIYALVSVPATGSGSANSQEADITGAGTSGSIGSGALAAAVVALSGFGTVATVTRGSGVLNAALASMSGFGTVSAPIITGSGVLLADGAQMGGIAGDSLTASEWVARVRSHHNVFGRGRQVCH